MSTYYFDSSALVKRYVIEEGTERVLQLLQQRNRLVVSGLAEFEVTSAVVRRAGDGGMPPEQLTEILGMLKIDLGLRGTFEVVELTPDIVREALNLCMRTCTARGGCNPACVGARVQACRSGLGASIVGPRT